ncbi:MFS transporter [Planctomicrobium sp. SH668]|uniref:MFS transporter n=1 Tax=Planctomicrobium sp. SH668 TaxID=3448126 RepID=UPI003F5C6020
MSRGETTFEIQPDDKHVLQRVMLSQFLFTSGNSLTVGAIFYYFVSQFAPSAMFLALLMITPELSQSMSLLAGRTFQSNFHNRKRNWIVFLILARLVAMFIPIALLWPIQGSATERAMQLEPLLFVLGCTVVWYLCQGISYINLMSWLSDLVPQARWGELFSRRQIASHFAAIGFPLLMLFLRQQALKGLPKEVERWSYGALFLLGGILTLSSIIPLLSVQHHAPRKAILEPIAVTKGMRFSASFLYLLVSRWWLAFFQGLTQAILFKFAVGYLHLSLLTYALLQSLMIFVQLPTAWQASQVCDAYQDRRGMQWSMVVVSFAMLLWMFSTPEHWWLVTGAYILWGGFGMLNVCGHSLCFKLSPRQHNRTHFALYEQISGLIAGLAGLLGGFWFDSMIVKNASPGEVQVAPYLLIFFVSWLGRLTAPIWLFGIKQPRPESDDQMN